MSPLQYALNLGLLAFVLLSTLGTRTLTRRRLLLPLAIVAGVLVALARGAFGTVPTTGGDLRLELVLTAAGAALGVITGLLVRVLRRPDGTVATSAGAAFAAVWVVVIGGRMAFAYGAEHQFARQIGRFSVQHQISGAPAWTAAFVLMALAMVLTRVAVTAALANRAALAGRATAVAR